MSENNGNVVRCYLVYHTNNTCCVSFRLPVVSWASQQLLAPLPLTFTFKQRSVVLSSSPILLKMLSKFPFWWYNYEYPSLNGTILFDGSHCVWTCHCHGSNEPYIYRPTAWNFELHSFLLLLASVKAFLLEQNKIVQWAYASSGKKENIIFISY